MSIRQWLANKLGSGPKVVGTSKGGSRLIKYGGHEFDRTQFGFTDESTQELVELREKSYDSIFGKSDLVYHEIMPMVPHIDIFKYPPTAERPFYTFITSGMSDIPMTLPKELSSEYRRIELVLYTSEDKPEFSEMLRRLAHFPHDNQTWLHWGHTMPNGTPAELLFDSSCLDSFFFIPSIVRPDSELGKRLIWQGEPIHLVWCVPISTAECNYKLEKGSNAIYDLFDKFDHPIAFSSNRKSYV